MSEAAEILDPNGQGGSPLWAACLCGRLACVGGLPVWAACLCGSAVPAANKIFNKMTLLARLQVNLRCPLSTMRIRLPAKGLNCRHVQATSP